MDLFTATLLADLSASEVAAQLAELGIDMTADDFVVGARDAGSDSDPSRLRPESSRPRTATPGARSRRAPPLAAALRP
ncbi:MAG: hypothetical protein QOH57_1562 [Mycobacterium sp.]|jgi:hypothetical protein|nr:hypothetical protein [Mycobacterium sp.]